MMKLTLYPHIERGGFHLDRFDAYLGDKLVVVSRQPLYDSARALLDLGVAPDTLLTVRHVGKDHDSFVPRPIGELAKWTIVDSDRGGLQRREWRPYAGPQSVDIASPDAAEAA
jgi:hypothetical protein